MAFTENDSELQEGTGAPRETDFVAPLASVSRGRLVFEGGVNGLTLRAGVAPDALVEAHFVQHAPRVTHDGGIVRVRYERLPLLEQLLNRRPSPADFLLNAAVPWELEFRGGVSQVRADLSAITVRSLDLLSGASHLRMVLPAPAATTFVYISGGISHGALSVPARTGVRLQIGGGASGLTFIDQRFGAIGGDVMLQTANYDQAQSRYDICVSGGVSQLTIETISKEVSQ